MGVATTGRRNCFSLLRNLAINSGIFLIEETDAVSINLSERVGLGVVDGRVAGHLGPAVGLKTLSIHVCVCPHFGM